ncbi:MAG: hypothetical protein Q9207_007152 [Kuettlingeria erythrocarpa]
MAALSRQPDLKHISLTAVDRRDSEAGPLLTLVPPPFPRWPRILGAALNTFVLSASVSIMGVLAHSLHNYSGTRNIHFGGTAISWPKDLDLHPAYLILASSAMSVTPSLLATVLNIRRLKLTSLSMLEQVLALISGVLLLMWIAADGMQGISEKAPRTDLLSWACRRRDSPTNVLVSYTLVCDESQAVKYLSILVTIAEFGILISCATTWHLSRRWSRLTDEPWRIKA